MGAAGGTAVSLRDRGHLVTHSLQGAHQAVASTLFHVPCWTAWKKAASRMHSGFLSQLSLTGTLRPGRTLRDTGFTQGSSQHPGGQYRGWKCKSLFFCSLLPCPPVSCGHCLHTTLHGCLPQDPAHSGLNGSVDVKAEWRPRGCTGRLVACLLRTAGCQKPACTRPHTCFCQPARISLFRLLGPAQLPPAASV